MSSMQVIMNFELLPNEILITCFEYLNAPDLFYSFDQLNYRFNKLIRTYPLHLNCQCVRKSIFDQFCMKMLANPEIKTQIRSLHLSNSFIWSSYKLTSISVETFLSSFSLDSFFRLQSVTLTGVKETSVEQLCSMLPALPELRCLQLINFQINEKKLLSTVLMSKLANINRTIVTFHPITNVWNTIN